MGASPVAPELPAAVPEKTSLYYSLPTVGPKVLAALASLFVFSYFKGWPFWLALLVLPLVALGTRRLDLDSESLTLVPMLPFLPGQRFEFRCLGPFHRNSSWKYRSSPYTTIQADINEGPRYRIVGLFPSRKITLGSLFAPSYRQPAISGDRLLELLEQYRTSS